jgi:Secretion system C-terminal sorting domain
MKKLLTLTLFATGILLSASLKAVPKLSSYPSAIATIFLDFDGHNVVSTVWNNGNEINCAPAALTDLQITEAFNRTAEDYRPFDINITTDSSVFLAAPINKRIRVIITPTSAWYSGVGGIAYVGSFNWGDDTPAFVFSDKLGPNNPKMIGECCSHESGHTVGLSHQSKYGSDCYAPIELYNSGVGTGEPAWAPIMGNSYYKNMSNWNNGPTQYSCNSVQDNLSIITSQNGFGYRTDDYTETSDANTTLLPTGNFNMEGVVSTNIDKDAFKIDAAQNTNLHLSVIPFSVGANNTGANLDVRVEIFNASSTLINTYDPEATMSIIVDTVLSAGTYFIKVSGAGNVNIGSYGSLGSYTISGVNSLLPIRSVALTGNTNNGKHNLNWKIISDEPIQSIEVENSSNGIIFSTINTVSPSDKMYTLSPNKIGAIYYRLKVISNINEVAYSNKIVLKELGKNDNNFTVSTFIHNEITVQSSVPFYYQLSDINGRVINKGNGNAGVNEINITQQSKGMYFLQLFSNNQKTTKRIIKQ